MPKKKDAVCVNITTKTDEEIIKILDDKRYIEFDGICFNCTDSLFTLILHEFGVASFQYAWNEETGMFNVRIQV